MLAAYDCERDTHAVALELVHCCPMLWMLHHLLHAGSQARDAANHRLVTALDRLELLLREYQELLLREHQELGAEDGIHQAAMSMEVDWRLLCSKWILNSGTVVSAD